jgi:hypothetical protein
MGTRGFIGFVVDGVEKIAYNHWDSYPGGLGLDVLRWLRGEVGKMPDGMAWATEQVRALRVVDPQSSPTAEDIERLADFANLNVEAYRGFQHTPHQLGRFAGRASRHMAVPSNGTYYPCALVGSWPLKALPTDEEFLVLEGGDDE